MRYLFEDCALDIDRRELHRGPKPVSIEPQVVGNATRIIDVFLSDPAMAKILLTDAMGLDIEFDRRLLAFYAELEALLEESLAEGQTIGLVQPGNVRVYAHFILGGLKEVVLQFTRAPVPVDREAAVREIYAVLSRGVLAKPPRRTTKAGAAKANAEKPRRKRTRQNVRRLLARLRL